LTNEDIAEISGTGVVDNHSGGDTATELGGLGNDDVDFGRPVATGTAVDTIGPSGGGLGARRDQRADRSGDGNAVFVDTNDSAGASADRMFRLVVACWRARRPLAGRRCRTYGLPT
jgi:hypothetical protein